MHENAYTYPGSRSIIIATTAADIRDIVVEGESGIIATEKPWNTVHYEPSKRRITWENKAMATLVSADEPERFRGLQGSFAWLDEVASYLQPEMVWSMLRLGLRLPAQPLWPKGYRPRILVTTTPQPTNFVKKLIGWRPFTKDKRTHLTKGSTYDNRANLDPDYFETIVSDLEGTRLGLQELHAVILDDVPGALWKQSMITDHRITKEQCPPLKLIVVGVDPNAGGDNEAGIVVCATGGPPLGEGGGEDEFKGSVLSRYQRARRIHGYVLEDCSLRTPSPEQWAKRAVRAFHEHDADCLVAEQNQGGEMVRFTIHSVDPDVPVKLVSATKNKRTRAEPIVSFYEQGRVHHVGTHGKLEEQLTTWDPEENKSPDRLDGLVWALSHLLRKDRVRPAVAPQMVRLKASPFAGGMPD